MKKACDHQFVHFAVSFTGEEPGAGFTFNQIEAEIKRAYCDQRLVRFYKHGRKITCSTRKK